MEIPHISWLRPKPVNRPFVTAAEEEISTNDILLVENAFAVVIVEIREAGARKKKSTVTLCGVDVLDSWSPQARSGTWKYVNIYIR